MNFSKATLLIATALVFCFAAVAGAQPHEAKTSSTGVQLGDARVSIPPPEGFEEASLPFQQVRDRFVATEAPQNDVLLVHLPTSDCDLLRKGSNPTYDFYTKVSVLRAGRTVSMSNSMMKMAVASFRKEAESYLQGSNLEKMERHMEKGLSRVDSRDTKIDVDKPVFLGEFQDSPNVFSALILVTIKVSVESVEATTPMVISMSYVRVKERIIFVYVLRKYEAKADQETVKAFSKKWTSGILAANKQASVPVR